MSRRTLELGSAGGVTVSNRILTGPTRACAATVRAAHRRLSRVRGGSLSVATPSHRASADHAHGFRWSEARSRPYARALANGRGNGSVIVATLSVNSSANSREVVASEIAARCAPDRIRTGTPPLLRGLPLPVGLRGQPQPRARSPGYGRVFTNLRPLAQPGIRHLALPRHGPVRLPGADGTRNMN